MRILIIEDDSELAAFAQRTLEEARHNCDLAEDGANGLSLALDSAWDLLIVDRNLPKLNGIDLVAAYRKQNGQAPVLFLSAFGSVEHRVEGLTVGGDDYLVKPFAPSELVARVEALGRRGTFNAPQTRLRVGDLEMDLLKRTVTRAGQKIDLQPREFRLLEFLMQNAGNVVTRSMLLEKVWDYHFDPMTNVIDVHVSRLRAKIDKEFGAPMLQTVRGSGYRLEA
jgi:two-component system, OmpR family, response regulator